MIDDLVLPRDIRNMNFEGISISASFVAEIDGSQTLQTIQLRHRDRHWAPPPHLPSHPEANELPGFLRTRCGPSVIP